MSAYQVMGIHEFAARFWSAVLAAGTVLCTYLMGRRLLGASAGLWAGIALATSLLFGVAGRAATPDSCLIFCGTLALTIYVLGVFRDTSREQGLAARPAAPWAGVYFPEHWPTVAAMYAVMGLAVLAKGPVGFVLPMAVIGMFLLIMRAFPGEAPTEHAGLWMIARRVLHPLHLLRTCWVMRPGTAIAASLVVAAPWYVWVGLRTDGEFLRGFFWEHNVGRAMSSMEGHDGSLLFYPAAILIGSFPWSVFTGALLIDLSLHLRRGAPDTGPAQRAGLTLALCWVGVYVGLFSLAKTKLPSYVTPCYPGLALLWGWFLDRWVGGHLVGGLVWRRLSLASLMLVGLVLAIALPVIAGRFLPGEAWLGVVGLVPLAAGGWAWYWMERDRPQSAVVSLAVAATLFVTLLFAGVADRVSSHQQYTQLLRSVEPLGAETRVASVGLLEPSWVFYGGRPIDELDPEGDAAWMGGWIEDNGRWKPKPKTTVRDYVARGPCYFITTDRHLRRLQAMLPEGYTVLEEVPYFLRSDRLILLGPADRVARRSAEGRMKR